MSNDNFYEIELPYSERWENLTLANDFLFGKIFSDPELCLELVQMILPELNIEKVSFPELQKSVKETFETRGVRFDIYLRDDKNRIIVVEMQIVNRDNVRKRTRAYHSLMNLDAMDKETVKRYDDISETIVIFICEFDLFHLGRHIYTFKNICTQDKNLELNDGSSTIFLNTKGQLNDVSEKLKSFLNFVGGKTSEDLFVKKLERRMSVARQNAKWRQEYMLTKFEKQADIDEGFELGRNEGILIGRDEGRNEGLQIGRNEGILIGRSEGRDKARLEIARRMRSLGMNDIEIHALTDLSIDEIQKL